MGFLFLCLISLSCYSNASELTQPQSADATQPFHIQFTGYAQINGEYVFQILIKGLPTSAQPQLKRIGEPLGWGGYVIGPFHEKIGPLALNGSSFHENLSTLELDKPDVGFKIVLPFRKEVCLPK